MAKDISKRKIFERRRQENEALLNGVLTNMPIGFQLFDELGNMILMNESMKDILGIKKPIEQSDVVFLNVFHDAFMVLNGLDLLFKDVYLKGKNKNLEKELDFNVPENTWSTSRRKIFFELNIFPLYDENHRVVAAVCLSNEITKRKATEKLMLDQNKRLEEYAFTISHILRRPIANIISLSSLIKSDTMLNPEDAQLVEFLNESTHQLDQILKELNQNITIKPNYFNDYKNHTS
jgi:signal transduction histidine kinase